MIYSVFNDKRGVYAYYEGPAEIPINADLPVPRLPPVSGKIGVAAIVAARPLPPEARFIGEGWHARGIVSRQGGAIGAVPSAGEAWDWVKGGGWVWLAGGALAIGVMRRI